MTANKVVQSFLQRAFIELTLPSLLKQIAIAEKEKKSAQTESARAVIETRETLMITFWWFMVKSFG